jgi:hypothetical protein
MAHGPPRGAAAQPSTPGRPYHPTPPARRTLQLSLWGFLWAKKAGSAESKPSSSDAGLAVVRRAVAGPLSETN